MFYLSLPNPATSAISCTPTAGFLKTKQRAVNLVQFFPTARKRNTHCDEFQGCLLKVGLGDNFWIPNFLKPENPQLQVRPEKVERNRSQWHSHFWSKNVLSLRCFDLDSTYNTALDVSLLSLSWNSALSLNANMLIICLEYWVLMIGCL